MVHGRGLLLAEDCHGNVSTERGAWLCSAPSSIVDHLLCVCCVLVSMPNLSILHTWFTAGTPIALVDVVVRPTIHQTNLDPVTSNLQNEFHQKHLYRDRFSSSSCFIFRQWSRSRAKRCLQRPNGSVRIVRHRLPVDVRQCGQGTATTVHHAMCGRMLLQGRPRSRHGQNGVHPTGTMSRMVEERRRKRKFAFFLCRNSNDRILRFARTERLLLGNVLSKKRKTKFENICFQYKS